MIAHPEQEETDRTVAMFRKVWKEYLKALLHWSDAQIEAWSDHWNFLRPHDPTSLFLHEDELYYLAYAFIPWSALRHLNYPQGQGLIERVQTALKWDGSKNQTPNWDLIKQNVEAVLQNEGVSLSILAKPSS